MRYWWVNQNQTYKHESSGGYLWSPKRKADGSRNPFYEFMREVSPGDIILSFSDTCIRAVGIAKSHCYECPKPTEFGSVGAYWDQIGWKVDVTYMTLHRVIRPSDHLDQLVPVLPDKYSPSQASGRGNQAIYLTELTPAFMTVVASLIGDELTRLLNGTYIALESQDYVRTPALGLAEWEEHLQQELVADGAIRETEKQALVLARRGQGRFKQNVSQVEYKCRVTHVDRIEHLRASHIKPWRDSNNDERLDGENGLLLTPSIDHLFDRGFISFEDNGDVLISPVAHKQSLARMGVSTDRVVNVGGFSEQQRRQLDFHRNYVFLERGRR